MTPEEMVARLLYRDGLMLVIDKPAGMAVHRGPKGGESLEDHFDALRFGLPRAPALAHRLDRDTSGCLVLGRHRKALAALGKMFKTGTVGKTYWAVVEGGPAYGRRPHRHGAQQARRDARLVDEAGSERIAVGDDVESDGPRFYPSPTELGPARVPHVNAQVGQALAWGGSSRSDGVGTSSPQNAATPPGASGATLPFQGRDKHLTWLAMEPVTGRTHQLRVHAAEAGWPIVGDNIYGSAPRSGGRSLHLHSREVIVPISKNKPPVAVTAPVPEHMRERLRPARGRRTLSPCGRGWRVASLASDEPGEGFLPHTRDQNPSPASQPSAARHPLPQGERETS